jgi:hypothetical protein
VGDRYFYADLPVTAEGIDEKTDELSIMRRIFTRGTQKKFPISKTEPRRVGYLPGLGYQGIDVFPKPDPEGKGEICLPTFVVQTGKDWKTTYMEAERFDVVFAGVKYSATNLADFEEEACFRAILPAATSSAPWDYVKQSAPIYQMPKGDQSAGKLSKELINRMMIGMERRGRHLKLILISPEDMEDIRNYSGTDVDPMTAKSGIWDINIMVCDGLGVTGKWNINGNKSEWGPFKGQFDGMYNNYRIEHPNLMDENGSLIQRGETQIYGFDTDCDAFHLYSERFRACFDHHILNRQKVGFFGWKKMGVGILDADAVCMGIIDRSL